MLRTLYLICSLRGTRHYHLTSASSTSPNPWAHGGRTAQRPPRAHIIISSPPPTGRTWHCDGWNIHRAFTKGMSESMGMLHRWSCLLFFSGASHRSVRGSHEEKVNILDHESSCSPGLAPKGSCPLAEPTMSHWWVDLPRAIRPAFGPAARCARNPRRQVYMWAVLLVFHAIVQVYFSCLT